MGRKSISGVPKTETPLRIRVTADERAILDAEAEKAGVPTSTWARDILLKEAARKSKRKPS
jgi:Mobilization protein NikA